MALYAIKTVTNPTLDANGRVTTTFSQFQKVLNAVVSGSDGYVAHVQGIAANVVTLEVRRSGALTHAGAAVADHPVHAHDFISLGIGGAVANAMGLPAGLNAINDAGAAGNHTVTGGGATGVQNNAAAQTHAVTQPNDHAAAVLAALGAGAIVAVFRVIAEGI